MTFMFKGKMLTVDDLKLVIMKSEENATFKLDQFVKFFLIHFIYFTCSPVIGILFILFTNGFSKGIKLC